MVTEIISAPSQDAARIANNKNIDDYTKRIARAMRQMMQYLDTHSRQLLKNQDITVPQVMCLDVLREKGTMAVAMLAKAIHLSPSTTVGIIDRLEKKKLVKRTRGSVDRRSVYVEITEPGRNFVVAAPHLLHNRLQGAMESLPRDEQIHIADSLDRLVHVLKNDPGA
jgi:DNA-binding MarR family transcriptional regulator